MLGMTGLILMLEIIPSKFSVMSACDRAEYKTDLSVHLCYACSAWYSLDVQLTHLAQSQRLRSRFHVHSTVCSRHESHTRVDWQFSYCEASAEKTILCGPMKRSR